MGFYRTGTQSVYSGYTKKTSTSTTSKLETRTDSRSAKVKTPPGAWRPPTNYSRKVETGFVACVDSQITAGYFTAARCFPSDEVVTTYTGAANCSGYYYAPIPAFPSNLEDQAIIKARLKLKDQKVNLGQAFGERAQTVRLVGDTITSVIDIVQSIKHGRVPKFLRSEKQRQQFFFNKFLEERYGWEPLLADVRGACEALHEREKTQAKGTVTVRSAVKSRDFETKRFEHDISNVYVYFDRVREIEHKGWMRLDFTQSNGPPTGTFASLGITNPFSIAWELVPWSFVADWFIPVGDWLSALDATIGWDFKGGSFSSKTTVKVHPNNVTKSAHTGQYRPSGMQLVSGHGRQLQFTRKAYGAAPMASRPNFSKLNKASHDHVANGIALLMSAITGKSRVR